MSSLRLILGDQLNPKISSLDDLQPTDVVLMAEVNEEATYVPHHKKKIAFLFSAMRHFARELEQNKNTIEYIKYDDPNNAGSLFGEVKRQLGKSKEIEEVVVTEPGEYRLLNEIKTWQKRLNCRVKIKPDTRFIATHDEFKKWSENKKTLTMEYWYRYMRKKTGILMEGDEPVGGRWNFDKENRKPIKDKVEIIAPKKFKQDKITKEVIDLVSEEFQDHFGQIEPFWFAVTRKQAEQAFSHFIEKQLPFFGDYQDAMLSDEPFLFHSIISHYINSGLLDPMEVCLAVEQAYLDGHVPINAAEGFIRQIIGWREYIRGIYWLYMPEYKTRNHLNADRPLPGFYWTAKTKMNCVSQVVNMTEQHAYSHHIQRLMVTGNFANLAGLDVEEVCDWYLAVYADAYEWVELPNTLGMALYADGGVVGSKPYISGGAYINRMSNYCKACQFDHKQRVGEQACPFTNLYWNYLIQHEQKLRSNRRMMMMYRNLDRFSEHEKKQIVEQANKYLDNPV